MADNSAIYDVNDTKRKLIEVNRNYNNRKTWANAFNLNNMFAAKSQSALEHNYLSAANDAYSSYLANQNDISNSNIVGASKQQLYAENQTALDEAYNTYIQNFYNKQQNIEAGRTEGATAIDDALTLQAQNIQGVMNYAIDYLPYLYEQYRGTANKDAGEQELFDRSEWNKFIIPAQEEDLEKGIKASEERLMTKEELLDMMYDGEGNLTLQGAKFFDQIYNSGTGMNNKSSTSDFLRFLAETDSDLYNWAISTNQYDYATGTNFGQVKDFSGLDPYDIDYTALDRLAGWTEDDVKGLYAKFDETYAKISEMDFEKQGKEIVTTLQESTNEVFKLAEDLGIDGALKDMGFDKESMAKIQESVLSAVKDKKEMNADWWSETLAGVGTGALVGAGAAFEITKALGAFAASGLVAGPGGALITSGLSAVATVIVWAVLVGGGAIIGGTLAGSSATKAKKAQKAQNKQLATEQQAMYKQLIDAMTAYSLQLNRQAEIDFNAGKQQ